MSKKQWVINKRLFEFLVIISFYTHVSPKFSRNVSIFLHDWFMRPSARNPHVDRTFGLATSHDCLPAGGPSWCHARHVIPYMHSQVFVSRINVSMLVHAFITSRVDYCNSLLYGLPNYQLHKLQRVLNASARLVCNVPRFCHILPILRGLHWIPVKTRIQNRYCFLRSKQFTAFLLNIYASC